MLWYKEEAEKFEHNLVIVKPGSAQSHQRVEAYAYILGKEDGSHHKPSVSHFMPIMFFLTWGMACCVTLSLGKERAMPEEDLKLSLCLWQPTLLEKGEPFTLQDDNKTTGTVPITETLAMTKENRISDGDDQVLELRAALISVPSCGHKLGPS